MLLAINSVIMTACSSLGGGSVNQRAAKLATGIEQAYAIQSNTAQRVAPMIVQNADRYDLDPLLLAALIQQESHYRSNVVSPTGAVGLTQITPRYWQQSCPGNLFDENNNISCGSYILANYKQSTGSWKKALAYYNVGPAGYEKSFWTRHKAKKYARSVKRHQKILKDAL